MVEVLHPCQATLRNTLATPQNYLSLIKFLPRTSSPLTPRGAGLPPFLKLRRRCPVAVDQPNASPPQTAHFVLKLADTNRGFDHAASVRVHWANDLAQPDAIGAVFLD
jgi:hypothetical protein